VTAFAKRLDGLVVRDPSTTPPLAHVLNDEGRGRGVGAQFLTRWAGARGFSGWLAYTVSRTERQDADGAPYRLADFDQTHVLAAVLGYQAGAWAVGSRLRYATGAPRSPVVGAYYDGRSDQYAPLFGAVNSTRLPSFLQLDLRAERSFLLARTSLDLYAELLNVTDRRNAEEVVYNFDYSAHQTITGLPFLAFAGVRLRF
jgi:hypothetical protein